MPGGCPVYIPSICPQIKAFWRTGSWQEVEVKAGDPDRCRPVIESYVQGQLLLPK